MSAMADYYAAMAREKDAQTLATQQQASQIALDSESRRGLQGAQTNQINQAAATIAPQADAEIAGRRAATNLAITQTALAPASAQAENAQRLAGAGLARAQTAALPVSTQADSTLRLAQAGAADAGTQQTLAGLQPAGLVLGDQLDQQLRAFAASKGYTLTRSPVAPGGREKGGKVYANKSEKNPKNGSPGKTDTVPMMLAPGEAVLNRGAAEHLGDGVLDHLNKMGLMRMAAQEEVHKHAAALDGHSVTKVAHAARKARTKAAGKSRRGRGSKAA